MVGILRKSQTENIFVWEKKTTMSSEMFHSLNTDINTDDNDDDNILFTICLLLKNCFCAFPGTQGREKILKCKLALKYKKKPQTYHM